MALVQQTIKNLIAGISQQPPKLRHAEQLEEQINGFSTEAVVYKRDHLHNTLRNSLYFHYNLKYTLSIETTTNDTL